MRESPQEIVARAIDEWSPSSCVILFSGGYDSMCLAHVAKSLDLGGLPVSTWSIDTCLSADGWAEFVSSTAEELGFPNFKVWKNEKGFSQYVEWVRGYGCPRNITGHTRAYARLKERAIDAIHMINKAERRDKTLFLSGMRKFESVKRTKEMVNPVQRMRSSNKIFANPLFWWTDEDVTRHRIENDFPENPFYNTVKGSGDCQCNWGNFIDMETLVRFSPTLARGNIALVDRLSREGFGYGWDEDAPTPERSDMDSLFDMDELIGEGEITPFLCRNCSRIEKHRIAEERYFLSNQQ